MRADRRHLGPRLAAAFTGVLLLPAAAGAAELTVTLEPTTATVGDRVEAVLVLSVAPGELGGEPRFPAWGDHWGSAEIEEVGPVETLGGRGAPRFRQRLVLTAFQTGTLGLPPQRVVVPGAGGTAEVRTPDGLALEIESVLPAETDGASLTPRPPAPPAPLPVGRAFWWTLAAMVVLTAATFFRMARRDEPGRSVERPRSARAELDDALAAATEARAAHEGHVLLSLALRRFLGRGFGFPAAESTTSEIRRQLRGRRCPPSVEGRIHEVLQACDRVKFAREPVAQPALEARVEAAREIADAVEDHLRPPAPVGTSGRREEAA